MSDERRTMRQYRAELWRRRRRRQQVERIDRLLRSVPVVRLYSRGVSSDEIARRLNLKTVQVRRIVQTAIERVANMTEHQRQLAARQPFPAGSHTVRRQALELRKRSLDYDVIGDILNISPQTAAKMVVEELHRLDADESRHADISRRMHLEKLDTLMRGVWVNATAGQLDAVRVALQIMERQSKLLGLDAPTRVDIEARLMLVAEEEGLDPIQVREIAEEVISKAKVR